MRRLIWLFLFVLLLAGAWLGSATLIAGQLRGLSKAGLGFQAASVTPLREMGRIGADLRQVALDTPMGRVELPMTQLFVQPTSPTTIRLALPAQGSLDAGTGSQPLGLTDPVAWVRLAPMSGFAPARLNLSFGPMTLAERPLAEGLSVDAVMVPLGHDAPQDSVSAHDVSFALNGLQPATLPRLSQALRALGLDGSAAITGHGRLWLDQPATPGAIAAAEPRPSGLRIDNADLSLGRIKARIAGFVRPDADGRAIGAVAIYTRDATPMLEAAAKAGLIPNGAVKLAGTMLRNLAVTPLPGENDSAGTTRAHPIDWPKAQDGELRLPILFANGRMALGPIPLGPAPLLR